jgi:hypothetical protein
MDLATADALLTQTLKNTIVASTRNQYEGALGSFIEWATSQGANPCDQDGKLILPVDDRVFGAYCMTYRDKSDGTPYSDGPVKKITSALKKHMAEQNVPSSDSLDILCSGLLASQKKHIADARKKGKLKKKAGKDLLSRIGYEELSKESIKAKMLM